jgi:hypothetical protein
MAMEILLQGSLFPVRRQTVPNCEPRGLKGISSEDGGDVPSKRRFLKELHGIAISQKPASFNLKYITHVEQPFKVTSQKAMVRFLMRSPDSLSMYLILPAALWLWY